MEFTRMNIGPIILRNQIEEGLEVLEWARPGLFADAETHPAAGAFPVVPAWAIGDLLTFCR